MGKEIEKIALDRGHTISAKFNSTQLLTAKGLAESDIAIEFTRPELAAENISLCMDAQCPVVIGTTGWYDQLDGLRATCLEKQGSMLFGTNFSIGVNISFFINGILARIMKNYPEYKSGITEIHHTKKLDAPSGTAISLADGIIENNPNYSAWEVKEGLDFGPTLPITAVREGEIPGTHFVTYESNIDSITLKHEAHNRKGFALGAVLAAEWLCDKKGVYSIKDMLNFDALI